jgi:hypothetical protein
MSTNWRRALRTWSRVRSTRSSADGASTASSKGGRSWVRVRLALVSSPHFSLIFPPAAESWDVSLHPRTDILATAGQEGRVRVLSSSAENFGEELALLEAAGSFGTAVEYVRRAFPPFCSQYSPMFPPTEHQRKFARRCQRNWLRLPLRRRDRLAHFVFPWSVLLPHSSRSLACAHAVS